MRRLEATAELQRKDEKTVIENKCSKYVQNMNVIITDYSIKGSDYISVVRTSGVTEARTMRSANIWPHPSISCQGLLVRPGEVPQSLSGQAIPMVGTYLSSKIASCQQKNVCATIHCKVVPKFNCIPQCMVAPSLSRQMIPMVGTCLSSMTAST